MCVVRHTEGVKVWEQGSPQEVHWTSQILMKPPQIRDPVLCSPLQRLYKAHEG